MRANGLFSIISTVFILFTAFSAAWPWPAFVEDTLNGLVRRQENRPISTDEVATTSAARTSEESSRATITSAAKTEDAAASTAAASASGTGEASASGTESERESRSGSGSRTSGKASKTTPIDPRLPPGGIQLITPAATDGAQYYKVGDYVTFRWNYTSLSVTPSAVDVLASCSINSAIYTISSNMSVEETGAVTWDLGAAQATATNPFPVASYTLIIHDAAKDVTDVPQAGYLGSYNQYIFGIYTGQPYVPLNKFECASCSGALSTHESQALSVLLFTSIITILSFSWFANGFGAFS